MKQFLIYHSVEMDASIEKERKWPELIWWKAVVFKVPWPLLSQARASPFPIYLSNNLWLEEGVLPPFPIVASVV